jgi:hypothetical protein
MIYKTLHRKLEQHENRVNTGDPDVHAPLVAPVVLLLNDTEWYWTPVSINKYQ